MGSMAVEDSKLVNPAFLDKIDKLREAGVSNFIPLPQLVAVGDQSSGKSSILEGLTQLPFPRDSGLCTRSATQITFRRAPVESISVSIIPSPSNSAEKKEKLLAYRKEGLKSLKGDEFIKILTEVCDLMGVPGPNQSLAEGQTSFSEDVLKIELCGPDKQHLTVIDVPGIFRTHQPGVTTKEDIELVRRILRSYIRDARTVILAVIPANVDVATQEILTLAEEVDPDGIRTMGVLTKPDLVDKGGEHNVIDLVLNKKHTLNLGYCIVRNRGQQELTSGSNERLRKEQDFFASEPWCHLDKDRVGTEALKKRLRELLQDITRREFPKVKRQIDQQLAKCRVNLKALGLERDTPEQQRKYLQTMAIDYGKITDAAIDAHYARNSVFSDMPELRLPTLIVDRSEKFSDEIKKRGHTINFLTGDDQGNRIQLPDKDEQLQKSHLSREGYEEDEEGGEDEESDESDKQGVNSVSTMMKALGIAIDRDDYPELDDLLTFDWKCPDPKWSGDVLKWIGDEYRMARGNGLVSLGPAVIPAMWQQQCRNWDGLTMSYISDIILFVHHFTSQLLKHICPDDRVRSNLLSMLIEPMVEQYKKALEHAKFIIHVERCGTILTHNHYYNANLQDARMNRLKAALKQVAQPMFVNKQVLTMATNCINVDTIAATIPMGNFEHDVKEIHDILKAYYKVARKRFVDNICMQSCDFHLISSEASPLRIFSPPFVSNLTDDQLEMIAGEDLSSRRQRKALQAEIEALELGKKVLRG